MKKFFILLNIVLIGLFAAGIIILHVEMKNGNREKYSLEKYNFVKITRPSPDIIGNWNTLFGIKPLVSHVKKSIDHDNQNKKKQTGLNQLNTGREIIRVKGIFITKNQQSAAIVIIPGKNVKRTSGKIRRIVAGDMIKGYKVVSILPESIALSDMLSNKVTLKIFAE